MTTLFPETTDGEGGDTAAEGGTGAMVRAPHKRRVARRSVPAEQADQATPTGADDSAVDDPREFDGVRCCYWIVYPASVHAVSHQLADKFRAAGKVVTLGTWADAEAVRVGMEQTVVPDPAPGALPGVGVGS